MPTSEAQRRRGRASLFDAFMKADSVKDLIDKYQDSDRPRLQNCKDTLAEFLEGIVNQRMYRDITFGGPLFRSSVARLKEPDSLKTKLFNEVCNVVNLDEAADVDLLEDETLEQMIVSDVLQEAYGRIWDIIGARVTVGFLDYRSLAVRSLKREFEKNGYEEAKYQDDDNDYFTAPKSGYYAYHFFVKIPGITHPAIDTEPMVSEIQVQTTISAAGATLGHDLLHKNKDWPRHKPYPRDVQHAIEAIGQGLNASDKQFVALKARVEDKVNG